MLAQSTLRHSGVGRVGLAALLAVLLAWAAVGFAQEEAATPDLSRINQGNAWRLINADCDTALEDGKPVVRMRPRARVDTGSSVGLALVEGLEFGEGSLEVDLKGKGKDEASFLGVAFGVVDGQTFEALYFRPFNFRRDPASFRVRAVQYVAWPEHTWEKLRRGKPGAYESAVKPVPDPGGGSTPASR